MIDFKHRPMDAAHMAAIEACNNKDPETLRMLAETHPEHCGIQTEAMRYAVHQSNPDAAVRYFGAALKHHFAPGGDWDLWHLMAAAQAQMGIQDEAEAAITLALKLSPKMPLLWATASTYAYHRGDHEEARRRQMRCLSLEPFGPHPSTDLHAQGEIHLLMGNYQAGWRYWDHRTKLAKWHHLRPAGLEPYNETSAGQRLLVWGEQGIGDQVQFLRFLKPFQAEKKARLWLSVHPSLFPWCSDLIEDGVIEGLITPGTHKDEAEAHVPLLSLPKILRTYDVNDLPAPYAPREPQFTIRRHQEPHTLHPSRPVGFCWRGNPQHGNDRDRSCSDKETFLDGLRFSGVTNWRNLTAQDEDGPKGDWMGTAQLVRDCSAVVTVDTAIAHVAGSLGVPTIVIAPAAREWRWGLEGATCPWYPTVHVIRKHWLYSWPDSLLQAGGVLKEIAV